jgi:carbamoyl-phosphate synthase small subunit
MKYRAKQKAVLVLEDGAIFHGHASGHIGIATGEVCFNTGMTGYQEIFTDPSYAGQIMLTTNAHIGNYGVHKEEIESSSVKISGLICKDFNHHNSRPDSNSSLQDYFEKEKLVAICDVDTRALVRYIRDKGAMNAIISSAHTDIDLLKIELSKVPSMKGLELSSTVSTKTPYLFGKLNSSYKVAVLDLGIKTNILRCLAQRDCSLKVFPMHTSLEEMLLWNPDGFFLSNGPGDPSAMSETVYEVSKIINHNIPVFGICLGHQMIGISAGLKTFKMHNGHRGINHPVINLETGKGEITSQNHGFSISMDSLHDSKNVLLTHKNLNDNSVEGIRLKNRPCFSVQYHPESSPGPHDSRYLFDEFLTLVKAHKNN